MSNQELHPKALTKLGHLTISEFLSDYWQKKPVLLKQALPNFISPLSADELAGLSLEEESQARLVIEKGDDWKVLHGPLEEDVYKSLPETNWSLLIQHADALDPEVNALLSKFRFLPNWRVDDIMVSYASDNGGVGPHFDYYDVFLLQAEGKRRWRIGQPCDNNSELVTDQAMKILANFELRHDWEVEAGDVIYIPAQLAHWGQAVGHSITYSIGFRAPSYGELLLDSTQHFYAELTEDQRFRDGPEILTQSHPGLIPAEAITRLKSTLTSLVSDEDTLAHWLAEFSTKLNPVLQDENWALDYASELDCKAGQLIKLSPFCRAAHVQLKNGSACYVNGLCFSMPLSLAEQVSAYATIDTSQLPSAELDTIVQLCEHSLMILVE